MLNINKDTQVNFKTNSVLLEKAKEIFLEYNLDLTAGFNLFLQNTVFKNKLPILTEEKLEKEILFIELQSESNENIKAIEDGHGVRLEDIRNNYGI